MNYYYYYFLERIGEQAFYGCRSMTYAYLHTSVKEVGASAFEGSGLTQAFWYTAAPVSNSCFADCASLETVGWGDVEGLAAAIGERGFYGCGSLHTMLIPKTVERIGSQAFGGRGGSALTLTFKSETPSEWEETETPEGLVLYVPDSKESGDAVYLAYLEAWKRWLGEHPETLLKTEDGAELRIFPTEPEPAEPETEESKPEEKPAEPEVTESGEEPAEPELAESEEKTTEPETESDTELTGTEGTEQ